jgi:hypothetical protein
MISDFVEVVADCILCLFLFWGEFATGDAGAKEESFCTDI